MDEPNKLLKSPDVLGDQYEDFKYLIKLCRNVLCHSVNMEKIPMLKENFAGLNKKYKENRGSKIFFKYDLSLKEPNNYLKNPMIAIGPIDIASMKEGDNLFEIVSLDAMLELVSVCLFLAEKWKYHKLRATNKKHGLS